MKSAIHALVVSLLLAAAIQVGATESGPKLAPIQLTPERRQLIGLQFAKVEEKELVDRIDATGLVEADEQLQGYVQTRFSGWIRQVFVDQTYQHVEKGQRLFTIYSPDLVSAENEYLIALNSENQLKGSDIEGVAGGAQSLVGSAVQRLKLFGVSPREIARLQRDVRPA
jgi:Cu(I)/Ag(I) efflux system membrane fusion protein